MNRRRIAVVPGAELQARSHLFRLLGELYPVEFLAPGKEAALAFDGAMIFDGGGAESKSFAAGGLNCLAVAPPAEKLLPVKKCAVNFSGTPFLDRAFRGQSIVEECVEGIRPLQSGPGDEVVCSLESLPYWAVRRAGDAAVSTVALPPPDVSAEQTVYEHFNRRRWLQMLPYFHFLKQIVRLDTWEPPPLRACLMFDDPNLHWLSYGFIDFPDLLRHAREHHYHVTMAMVPMDSWYVHGGAAALFRDNREFMSLCIHGNDHVREELGVPLDEAQCTQKLAQGLRRIESFEKKSGLSVARVLVPPYGAFREAVAGPMLRLGYEGVCVSRSSLTSWNKGKAWPPSFGHSVVEFVNGLPVIPRQVMAPGHEGTYRLAAFLDQPIIPHGHHQDCAGGLDLLARAAAAINGVGQVTWTDMASISRSNYLTKRVNDQLRVKMLSRNVSLQITESAQEVVVERPWISNGVGEELLICRRAGQVIHSAGAGPESAPIRMTGPGAVELVSPPPQGIDPRQVPAPPLKFSTVTRRVLSETRDRVTPMGALFRSRKIGSSNGNSH